MQAMANVETKVTEISQAKFASLECQMLFLWLLYLRSNEEYVRANALSTGILIVTFTVLDIKKI